MYSSLATSRFDLPVAIARATVSCLAVSGAAGMRGAGAWPTFCGVFQFGSLGHEDFAESLGLFADKVLPSLRSLP